MVGKLIVLEGGEGCGKSTQLRRLEQWFQASEAISSLRAAGLVKEVVVTREPGGTTLGQTLRRLLLDQHEAPGITPTAELLMYAADRAQHVETLIKPALERGDWVLCDRYIDSTVAYQGYGRNLDRSLIDQLNPIATGGLVGDLTLWLQLDAKTGLERTHQRGEADRMEQADFAFHQRVQQGFEALAAAHPERIVAIDARPHPDIVFGQIQSVIEQRLKQWYGTCLKA